MENELECIQVRQIEYEKKERGRRCRLICIFDQLHVCVVARVAYVIKAKTPVTLSWADRTQPILYRP